MKNRIFWNVDTQIDFMRPNGKLPVQDAQHIEPTLAKLTQYAKEKSIYVVNTADWHREGDSEIDVLNPDFINTYTPHCIANTPGAEFVDATRPENAYIIDWNAKKYDVDSVKNTHNLILYKNEFDVFTGNPHADEIVAVLQPDEVIMYGVATNVCVDKAIKGLIQRGIDVTVVEDAIKHLPHLDEMNHPLYKGLEGTLADWDMLGVKRVNHRYIL